MTNVKTQIEPKPPRSPLLKLIDNDPQVHPVQPDHPEVLAQVQARSQLHVSQFLRHIFGLPLLEKPPPWPWKQKQRLSSLLKCDALDYSPKTHGHAPLSNNAFANKLNVFQRLLLDKLLLLTPLKSPLHQPQNATPPRYSMMKPYLEYLPNWTPLSAPLCITKWKLPLRDFKLKHINLSMNHVKDFEQHVTHT